MKGLSSPVVEVFEPRSAMPWKPTCAGNQFVPPLRGSVKTGKGLHCCTPWVDGAPDRMNLGTGARSLPCSNRLPNQGKTGHFRLLKVPLG